MAAVLRIFRAVLPVILLPVILLAGLPVAAGAQAPGNGTARTPVPPPTAVVPKATPAAPPKDGPPLSARSALLPPPVLPRPLSAPALAAPPVSVAAPAAAPPVPAPAPSPVPAPPAVEAVPPVPSVPPSPPPVAEAKRDDGPAPDTDGVAPDGTAPDGTAIAAGRTVWATAGIFIRAEPSSRGLELDTLEKGQPAQALTAPDSGGWVRIARGGRPAGWVAGAYLTTRDPSARPAKADSAPQAGAATACLGDSPVPASLAAPGTRMRVTTDTRVRRAPSCESPAIDVISRGAVVTVLGGGADGWYRVRGAGWDGVYVAAKLLAPVRR